MDQLTDRELVRRVHRERSENAFLQLYDLHTPRLHRFVLRLVDGSEPETEDILQETWLRAVRGLNDFEWRSTLHTWLTGIALNVARSRRRRGNREVPMPDDPPADRPPLRAEARIDLERAIGLLPDGYRAVLLLHDLEGYTHREIGELLGVEAGTSKSQLHHARRAMRAALKSVAEEEDENA